MNGLKKIVMTLVVLLIVGFVFTSGSNIFAAEMEGDTIVFPAKITNDYNKVWNVKFNRALISENLSEDLIFIKDSEGKKYNVSLSVDKDDNRVVLLSPIEPYTNGEKYTIFILKGFKDAEGVALKNTIKMDFTVVNADIVDSSKTNLINDRTISGDLIINGGGHLILSNVEIQGDIIIEDIGTDSLILDKVKARKIIVRDTNGARIESKQGRWNQGVVNEIPIIEIENDSLKTAPIKIEGNFSETEVTIKTPVEVEVTKDTSIKKIDIKANDGSIKSKDGDIVSSVGEFTGQLPAELKTVQNELLEIKNGIAELDKYLGESNESYDDYFSRGDSVKEILNDLLGDKLGERYNNYDEYWKTRTANSVRAYLRGGREYSTLRQILGVIEDSINFNIIFEEQMKYAAHSSNKIYNNYYNKDIDYQYPIIQKTVSIGDDITNFAMGLSEIGKKSGINSDVLVSIREELLWNDNYYLDIDSENQKIYLNRLNNTPNDIEISFDVSFEGIYGSSKTNFTLILEAQEYNFGEIDIRKIDGYDAIEYIENDYRMIHLLDTARVGFVLDSIESNNGKDKLSIVYQDGTIVADNEDVTEGMKLEVERGNIKEYYKIFVKPFIHGFDDSVILDIKNNYFIHVKANTIIQDAVDALIFKEGSNYDIVPKLVPDHNPDESVIVDMNDKVIEGIRIYVDGFGFRFMVE